MRKILAVVGVALIVGVFFVFLASEKKGNWEPGRPLAKEDVKIGILYLTDVLGETSGYTYAHDRGIRDMQKSIGLRDNQILRKVGISDSDLPATEQAMRECIAAGANIIIATAEGYATVAQKLAGEFPQVVFAQLYADARNGSNLTSYFGRVYQARYLSGIIAGLRSATGKIGYVAAMGMENTQVTSGLNAFALGVEKVNPKAEILVKVTHRWVHPEAEFEAARSLIAAGCDVIAQHCDTPNPQLAAQSSGERGIWGIGYNSDMRKDAKTVITSVVWHWDVYYTGLVAGVIDGAFSTAPYLGGLREGIVGLTPFNESLMPAGAAEALKEARKSIESGAFAIFEGELESNDGRVFGVPGQRFADAEISGGINWYYRNVAELTSPARPAAGP
ncbi:MAG: BMP family ABC transporter substrate-binding protein [Desulfovibrionaceae bacterium]|nr:BMP family ABC transporter substrate-binding protein [Desulfovibrionaceae bacterium]